MTLHEELTAIASHHLDMAKTHARDHRPCETHARAKIARDILDALSRHPAPVLALDREVVADLLVVHARMSPDKCRCGWGELGHSHALHQADAILAAGYRKPTVQPTARPTTEGGVWGSYVAYLEALESRVQPTVEELERTIYDNIAFQGGDDEHFESVRGYIYHNAATAVHALFTTAPTVADVREQVARELWAKLPDTLRAQTHDDCGWLSDAQDAQLDATDDAVTFCGQGSIDVHHIADYAANLARGGE